MGQISQRKNSYRFCNNVSLSFVEGSKSVDGSKNQLADMDPGGSNLLFYMD